MSNFILEGTDGWDLYVYSKNLHAHICVQFETLTEALVFASLRGIIITCIKHLDGTSTDINDVLEVQ